jgi:hypothetical protein
VSVLESASLLPEEEEVDDDAWHRTPEVPPTAMRGGRLEKPEQVEACIVAVVVVAGECMHGIDCVPPVAVRLAELVQHGDLAS